MVQYTKMENGVVSNLTAEEETARLQKEQDWIDGAVEREAQEIISKRKAEYPSIEELVVALYDTEDKLVIETKRAAVKLKYPKENS